jgi:allophanate hydrolase subunit 2/allophanate hydrolase subunit 1
VRAERGERIEAAAEGVWVTPELQSMMAPIDRARAIDEVRNALGGRPDVEVIAGGNSLLVVGASRDEVALLVSRRVPPRRIARHEFAVRYDGPDLESAAKALGLTPRELVSRHQASVYSALLTGFLPGFAYLGDVDETLSLPRLAQPRARVPAGAVAIAGRMTAAYPFPSPGGWNLIGQLDAAKLFDVAREPPGTIQALDEVCFVESDGPFEARTASATEPIRSPALRVERVAGLATIQDAGRFGHRGDSVPLSGPLDSETHAAANGAVGNDANAATIELIGGSLTFVAEKALAISVDGAAAQRVAAGDRVTLSVGERLTSYLAIAGGVDVPLVLGSRSTLLVASLGGLQGRGLRKGDALAIGEPRSNERLRAEPAEKWARPDVAALTVRRSRKDPRLPGDAFDRLLGLACSLSAMRDRVGTRFDGGKLPAREADRSLPAPVVPGSIQVTTDGTLIALGPDAAVTGGYPVVAVLDAASRALVGRLRPGQRVVFRET